MDPETYLLITRQDDLLNADTPFGLSASILHYQGHIPLDVIAKNDHNLYKLSGENRKRHQISRERGSGFTGLVGPFRQAPPRSSI
jgi:hypothetical protein